MNKEFLWLRPGRPGDRGSIARRFITLMMETVRTSETSVNFNVTTRRYILEDSKLHNRRRENLKSHFLILI
jgi:hypothetical protein